MNDKTKFKFVSWDDLETDCAVIYSKMLKDNYKPDCIIGLFRGGIVPARIFSDYFNIWLDFFALDVKLYNGINKRMKKPKIRIFDEDIKGKEILVIDDIYHSGTTMKSVLEFLKGEKITTTTVFWKETAEEKPDYYAGVAKKDEWIVFPWEKREFKREFDKCREHNRKNYE